jgi:hypothetical protein
VHAKRAIYSTIYHPVTDRLFEQLRSPSMRGPVLAAAAGGVLPALDELNGRCHRQVGELVDDAMVTAAMRLRRDVLWVGAEAPAVSASRDDIRASLVAKLRRNASLGFVEATLCLDSAYHAARDRLRLRGPALRETLRRSRTLCRSLAALHDVQERQRLSYLTGREGYLEYPAVDYADVVEGRFRIPADRFVATNGEQPRLRFVSRSAGPVDTRRHGPTMRCPALRMSVPDAAAPHTDALWDLLIDIYQHAGRFS